MATPGRLGTLCVLLAASMFIVGFVAGHAFASQSAAAERRLAEEQCGSGLDELLGITPEWARAIRTDIQSLRPSRRPRWERPLHKHYKSKSVLQDVFVRYHSLCFQIGLLPITGWGVGRAFDVSDQTPEWMRLASERGKSNPARYKEYHAGPSVLTRFAWNEFMRVQAPRVSAGAACLGWDNTEYVDMVPNCDENRTWSLVYAPGDKVRVHPKLRRIVGSMDAMAGPVSNLGSVASAFDLIICNYVFEHVSRPSIGVRALYNLLRPSGLLFFAVPFNEQYHLIPGDFYRFTFDGARSLLQDVGFEIVQAQKLGDSQIASGYMLGFGAHDFEEAHLSSKLLQTVDAKIGKSFRYAQLDESLYMGTFIVAKRPGSRSDGQSG